MIGLRLFLKDTVPFEGTNARIPIVNVCFCVTHLSGAMLCPLFPARLITLMPQDPKTPTSYPTE